MYEWDENKRLLTIEKHGIDFLDAAEIFENRYMVLEARSDVEEREIAVGEINGFLIAVVFTRRDEAIRLITARRARSNERRYYQALFAGRNPDEKKLD